jgi:REP element-mobilizing transposase RayT
VVINAYVVMPNHFHGIIVIDAPTVGAVRGPSNVPPTPIHAKPLGRLISAFKTVSTKRINELHATPGMVCWQRNYYEHIIRHEDALNRIRRYIIHNPMKWAIDRKNPLSQR